MLLYSGFVNCVAKIVFVDSACGLVNIGLVVDEPREHGLGHVQSSLLVTSKSPQESENTNAALSASAASGGAMDASGFSVLALSLPGCKGRSNACSPIR